MESLASNWEVHMIQVENNNTKNIVTYYIM